MFQFICLKFAKTTISVEVQFRANDNFNLLVQGAHAS
jgi:hypothetical protein